MKFYVFFFNNFSSVVEVAPLLDPADTASQCQGIEESLQYSRDTPCLQCRDFRPL
jgi:hypothetical protein